MLRDKYRFVEDKIVQTRHKRAWTGLLVICAIATMVVVVGICYIVMEMNGQGPKPVDNIEAEQNEGIFVVGEEQSWIPAGILDQTNIMPLNTIEQSNGDQHPAASAATATASAVLTKPVGSSSIPLPESYAPARSNHGSLEKRKTVYSTTTVFVLPPATSAPPPPPPTLTRPPEVSETSPSTSAMTGNMYCPDPQRPKILTLCNWVHTAVPGMIDADEVPGTIPAADAASSAGGGRTAANPFVSIRLALLSLWAHVRQSVGSSVPYVATIRHRSTTGLETLHLCAATTTGELWEESRKLQESLDGALKLVRMQQGLLDSQEAIIEGQRRNLEEMAILLAVVQNRTSTACHTTTAMNTTRWESRPKQQQKVI